MTRAADPELKAHLLLLLLFLLLERLHGLVGADQLGEVGHVLVRLLQQVGQPLVFLLVDQLPVALLILRLRDAACRVRG